MLPTLAPGFPLPLPPFLLASLALAAAPAAAFTFSDGTAAQCVARGEVVAETIAAPDDPAMRNRTAWARKVGDGWQITWNAQRLASLPAEVRDFLFFHECAHARVPTEVELEANCAGLIDMRLAGRAGPEYEARLKRYFPGIDYWTDTFTCADAWFERERAKQGKRD